MLLFFASLFLLQQLNTTGFQVGIRAFGSIPPVGII